MVDVSLASRSKLAWTSLALLVLSLAVLHGGGFIRFDDTSGSGSDRWNLPLGVVAGLVALCSLGVGISDRTARRTLGGALAVLDALLVLLATVDDGFRFIWAGDEGELFLLQVGLGIAALFLLTPTFVSSEDDAIDGAPHSAGRLSGGARAAIYVSALVLTMLMAYVAGTTHFETTQCGPDVDGECDVAALEGLLWAGAALVLGVVAIVLAEVARARRRREAPGRAAAARTPRGASGRRRW
ncbi:hypothetical protein [Nocardioides dongkuii]|uniref:hypothetical protein n=1 Tax=Nocardioides dongkuii TaxID=2760089 RepID=UPI0015F8A260|nr:hypothetical protein [Nocardioides dongkuii]